MEFSVHSEASTGYLQDAVVECGERRKRLRTMSSCGFDPPAADDVAGATSVAEELQELLQMFWGSNCAGNISGDIESLFEESRIVSENEFKWMGETEKDTEKTELDLLPCTSPATSSLENYYAATLNFTSTMNGRDEDKRGRRRRRKKVAYPFAVLKPAGINEGDVTLAEINERILMRPTRPVRHPVGKFACMPCVPDVGGGPGLSGKAVVGLTRIHTQGRGTITIIRTRG